MFADLVKHLIRNDEDAYRTAESRAFYENQVEVAVGRLNKFLSNARSKQTSVPTTKDGKPKPGASPNAIQIDGTVGQGPLNFNIWRDNQDENEASPFYQMVKSDVIDCFNRKLTKGMAVSFSKISIEFLLPTIKYTINRQLNGQSNDYFDVWFFFS